MKIHNTAIVSKNAQLGKNCEVGPWCIVEGDVTIGDNTKLWQNVYVASGTKIGKDNKIHMGAVLGHEPQHLAYKNEKTGLIIGDGNTIREYVTIHRASAEGKHTVIGNNNYFMGYVHIAHDCNLADNIIMCQASMLGGFMIVESDVFIGGGSAAHQYSSIGAMAMIGGLTSVNKDVVPYMLVKGPDSEVRSLNLVGIRRSSLSDEAKKQIRAAYKIIYKSELNTTNALKELKKIPNLTKEVRHMVDFIERCKRGICKHR